MKKRLISMAMALLFIASLPVSAFADWYIDEGDIIVNAGSGGQTVTQGDKVDVPDAAPVITQHNSSQTTSNTVTIKAEAGTTANVTLKDVNIDVSNTGDSQNDGKAAVATEGDGDVNIELDGNSELSSGYYRAGLEKGNRGELVINDEDGNGSLTAQSGEYGAGIGGGCAKSGSDITINGGDVKAVGSDYGGAGIGGGAGGSGSDITINGGTVDAKGGTSAAGIGGGSWGSSSNTSINGGSVTAIGGAGGAGIGGGHNGVAKSVVISGDAQVKVQTTSTDSGKGNGAAIGNGGNNEDASLSGKEITPDTSKLTKNGKVMLYAPGENMETAEPKTIPGSYVPPVAAKAATQTVSQTVKLYRVVDKDGKDISYKTEVKDGVLTVTVDADYAVLTGTAANIAALTAQGVTTAVFVTSGATSTFDLADLSAKGSGTYKLTHDGATVTFTLDATDISEILK